MLLPMIYGFFVFLASLWDLNGVMNYPLGFDTVSH